MPSPSKPPVAWIGTGVMGSSMAKHILEAGYPLTVHNRTEAKAQPLLEAGARWAASPGEAAAEVGFIFSIVGFPTDVRDIYLGGGGIVERARESALICDMTTSEPSLAMEIAEAAAKRGITALDAPVSGGDIGAREARLSIMVGGEPQAFERARPLLEVMGRNIVLQGGPGAGQHTKMCNQISIASGMIGVVEALLYAKSAGLDPEVVLESIASGAAGSWSLSNLAPRIIQGDFAPGFYVRHFVKDMDIALSEGRRMGLSMPGLNLARELYRKLAELGGEEYGTQALYLAMEQLR